MLEMPLRTFNILIFKSVHLNLFSLHALFLTARMFGDPHLVTLDGLQYTFNGRGEFTLIETLDQSFTLQGRMAPPSDATSVRGTSLVALAMKQGSHPTVQLEVANGEFNILVGGEEVDFAGLRERRVDNVTVTNDGNATFTVRFTSGVIIQASERNHILTNILVTVPEHFSTVGLLGQFNGDPSDDLLSKNATVPLPTNSAMAVIHSHFGTTCNVKGYFLTANYCLLFCRDCGRSTEKSLHLRTQWRLGFFPRCGVCSCI